MIIGFLSYGCIKCGKPVRLEYRPEMTANCQNLFKKMFNEKICLDCHCELHIKETSEIVSALLQ